MRKWLAGFAVFVIGMAMAQAAVGNNAAGAALVKDMGRGSIGGARVTARNVETGLTRVALSDGSGEFRLPSLPPGRLPLAAELSGFQHRDAARHHADYRPDGDSQLLAEAGDVVRNHHGHRRLADRRRDAIGRVDVGLDAADSGPAGGVAPVDRSRHADAGHVAGQHPRPVLSRQRERRRRRPRVLQRLRGRRREQHVGGNGRAAPEFRDGRDPGIQGRDLQLQGGIRPRDRRSRVGRHQVGDQSVPRVGTAVLPRCIVHRERVLPDDEAGLPAVSVRRHERLADRQGQDPLLLRA